MAHYSQLVVFGDSLSDTGNNGRFSNGPVWVEHLARRLGVRLDPSARGGTNYAHGGAKTHGADGTLSLRAQAERFLRAPPAGGVDPRALYVVYGGGNDLRATYYGAENPEAVVARAVTAIGEIVDALARSGAVEVLAPNLPDLGGTPEARQLGPETARNATRLSLIYNEALERVLSAVEARHAHLRLHRLDVFALHKRAESDPRSFGFIDADRSCLAVGPACEDPDRFVFWDSMHPTAAAHAKLAEAALDALKLAP